MFWFVFKAIFTGQRNNDYQKMTIIKNATGKIAIHFISLTGGNIIKIRTGTDNFYPLK